MGRVGEAKPRPNMLSANKKDPAIRLIQRKERVTADTARTPGPRPASPVAVRPRHRPIKRAVVSSLYFVTAQLLKRSELIMTHCVCRY